ncbi:hypothetical protein [Micromonospora sp. LOL_015]|uniref:hypothetical protein n=1 Tax=Micromonospora sp. LOL_015 TaxID=3345416 RepID=UPI003A89E5E1
MAASERGVAFGRAGPAHRDGPAKVDGKTNELTRFQLLLAPFGLTATVVTADASPTQREHAAG